MKTKVILLCCFCVIAGKSFSQSWQVLNSGTTSHILEVQFVNSSTGFVACSDGKVRKTTDGGNTWVTVLSQSIVINSLYFVNENIGFGVGNYGRFFKTTNSGNSWSVSTPTDYHLFGVYFIDSMIGYVVGNSSCILKTTNGGATWEHQISPFPDVRLVEVYFVNNKGYISVLDGTTNLLFTTNGGALWQDGKIRSGVVLGFSVYFIGNIGVLVGYEEIGSTHSPIIFKTSNNGETWSEYRLSLRYGHFHDIAISPSNPNKMCVVGRYIDDPLYQNQGLIMRSTDGGTTWVEEQWPVENLQLKGAYATNSDFIVVGYNGLVLKTSHTVGISPINTETPSGFQLSQNYPNPFNPSTRINFSLPKAGNVKLAVYNIAGKEVAILINQSLSAGNYTADFDASNLTSGVYFYTLQSESFKDSKRMVLLK